MDVSRVGHGELYCAAAGAPGLRQRVAQRAVTGVGRIPHDEYRIPLSPVVKAPKPGYAPGGPPPPAIVVEVVVEVRVVVVEVRAVVVEVRAEVVVLDAVVVV